LGRSQANNESDRVRKAVPLSQLFLKLRATGAGERIIFRIPPAFGDAPGGFDPALLFQAVQGWIKRALADL
jgi:hypothetical protein